MKTMKYRSVFGTLCVAALSVFLFTACEKESDSVNGSPTKADRLSKFKSLVFSGSGTGGATSSTSGSGTFIGGGNSNISFSPPQGGGGTGNGAVWAPTVAGGGDFTDPMSTSSNQFVVGTSLFQGGGSVNFGSKTYELNLALCASSDIFGENGRNNDDLQVFIGVSGDFSFDALGNDEDDLPIDFLLYVFSYNGSSKIGSFDLFDDGSPENSAFVLAVEYGDDHDEDGTLYFAKSGSVDFSGEVVTLSSVKMAKVIEGDFGDDLSSSTTNLSAFLECVSFDFGDDDEEQGEF